MNASPHQFCEGWETQTFNYNSHEENAFNPSDHNPWEYGEMSHQDQWSTYPIPEFYPSDQGDHSQHYVSDEMYWEIQKGLQ